MENEIVTVPGRRLGRRRPLGRAGLRLGRYLTSLPAVPGQVNHIAEITAWNGDTNKTFGTCGPCSLANNMIAAYWYLTGELISVSDYAIFDLYRRSGNPGFNPVTGADDNGVELSVMLDAALAGGLDITHADGSTETVRPLAYAALDTADIIELRAATAIFGSAIMGLSLDVAQQEQPVWDYVFGSAVWGGHATDGAAYTSAVTGTDETLITWQEPKGTTDLFVQYQMQEAYAVILPITLANPGVWDNLDIAQLAADYTALTGRTFPLPPPPPVPPDPDNPPDPDITLAGIIRAWDAADRTRPDLVALKVAHEAWLTAKGL